MTIVEKLDVFDIFSVQELKDLVQNFRALIGEVDDALILVL